MAFTSVDFNKIEELATDVRVHASYASKILAAKKDGIFSAANDNQTVISKAQLTYQLTNLEKERAVVAESLAADNVKQLGLKEIDKNIGIANTALGELEQASKIKPPIPNVNLFGNPFEEQLGQEPAPAATPKVEPKKEKPVTATSPTAVAEPKQNILFNYASYTYNLSLHVIPLLKYNKLANNELGNYTPGWEGKNTVLVASAGKWSESFGRHPAFKRDYFFTDLKMTTVVGMSKSNGNTNAIDISFTILEPMGISFLDNLIKVVDDFGIKSWMQTPFLLQIDFVGAKQLGDLDSPIPDQTKYIPIRIIGCDLSVTARGSEYKIKAVPFNHQALQSQISATPANFEVTSSNLQDFFSPSGNPGEAKYITSAQEANRKSNEDYNEKLREENKKQGHPGGGVARSTGPDEEKRKERAKKQDEINKAFRDSVYRVGSYTAALNDYQKQLVKSNMQEFPDIFRFEFSEDILAQSTITWDKTTNDKTTPMYDNTIKEAVAAQRGSAGLPSAGLDYKNENFFVEKGKSIIEVITLAMLKTDFIRSQIKNTEVDFTSPPEQIARKVGKAIKWFKITPKVEFEPVKFDNKRSLYPKKITFYVQSYEVANTKDPNLEKSIPTKISKKYSYIYTGENYDILDLKLDFNTLFYTQLTENKSKYNKTSVTKITEDSEIKGKDEKLETKPGIQENPIVTNAGSSTSRPYGSADVKSVAVNDAANNLLSDSRGDMINLDLKIIGDPDYIKQDEIFFIQPNSNVKNKSLPFDKGEIYCNVNFKSFLDFDEETGLGVPGSEESSSFSGIYRVMIVDSTFNSGKFTQSLNLIRLFGQDVITKEPEKDTQRTDTKETEDKKLKNFSPVESPAKPVTKESLFSTNTRNNPFEQAADIAAQNPALSKKPFGDVVNTKANDFVSGGLYANTSNADLTYTGNDSIVWDRINQERTSRGLQGLAQIGYPRPAD